MKNIFFVALSVLLISVTSCTNDAENSTPLKVEQVNNDLLSMKKVGDTLPDSDTGGQGGYIPPTRP